MNTKQQLDIDLIKIADVAHIGVRRAAIFMGLGLHAVERDDFNEYQLGKLPIGADQTEMLINFFPPDLSGEKVKEFKGEFEKWIISTGIKELIEHYALLLDRIHEYSLAVARNAGKLLDRDPERLQKDFEGRGFARKFEVLKERFAIEIPYAASLSALYLARNALTHKFGFVGANHCSEPGLSLTLTWPAFDSVMVGTETGKEIALITMIGKVSLEPMQAKVRRVTRQRVYKLGDRIRLLRQDLSEICAFFSLIAIPETMKVFSDFLLANGVKQVEKAG